MRKFHVNQSPEAHYTVYKLTSPTGKLYIGYTGRSPRSRWHNGNGYRHNTILNEDIEAFGWTAFTKEIVCEKLTKEGAEAIEKSLIEMLDTRDPEKGYNVFTGGKSRGSKASAEGIARCSKAKKENFQRDPSLRKRMSVSMIKKVAEDPNFSASISATCKKVRATQEYREALSKRAKAYYARTCEKPVRKAILVMCIETGKIYPSMFKAEKAIGVDHRNISYVCNGRKYTAGGYHWKFA